MPPADTSEKGLETLIMLHLTGVDGFAPAVAGVVQDALLAGGCGWLAGNPTDFDRTHALDVPQLFQFIEATQPQTFQQLGIADYRDTQNIARLKFLARLQGEISKRGVVDVLRHGMQHGPARVDLFYGTPSPGKREGGRAV